MHYRILTLLLISMMLFGLNGTVAQAACLYSVRPLI